MDMGGDGNRLYYYDPQSYLLHDAFYMADNVIEGIRTIEPHYYHLPYVLLLLGIKKIISSSSFLIDFINGLKLSLSFLSVYFIIRTILQISYKEKKEIVLSLPAILGGLFYITTPIMIGNYDKALISQNQVFLNPLLFYLLLVYFLRQKIRYLVFAIVISFIFTPNFSWASAPPFFSFFPLALLFLLFYIVIILKKRIIFSQLLMGILLLLGLHAFHLIPEIYNLLSPGSYVNERVFDKNNTIQQLNYFYGVLPLSKLSLNLLMHAPFKDIIWASIIPSLFVILGFVLNKFKNRIYLLTGIFFLITLYLLTANITSAGVKLYESFFYIPGFSMFRNFIGQWAFVFSFFYSLIFGQAIYLVYQKIEKSAYRIILTFLISILFVASASQFFTGSLVNKTLFQSKDIKIAMKMDPQYEKLLQHAKSLHSDDAVISFPFTDCCYSVVHGTNNGAYVGPSPLRGLAGVQDYNGYVVISPFGDEFIKLAKEKNYQAIKQLFGLLDIKYIYYNSDPKVYDSTFGGYPYNTVREYLPKTQKEYKDFITSLTTKKIYQAGYYQLYQIGNDYPLRHFYTPKILSLYQNRKSDLNNVNVSFFEKGDSKNVGYIAESECEKIFQKNECNKQLFFTNQPQIHYERINPNKYIVHVKRANKKFVLVFSATYHPNWDIHIASNESNSLLANILPQKKIQAKHFMINGYANAWYLSPKDVDNKTDYDLVVDLSSQKVFYVSLLITALVTFVSLCLFFFFLFKRVKGLL